MHPWEAGFLKALALTGNITKAAAAAKVSRRRAYQVLAEAADFAEAWQDALEDAADGWEAEAVRRAVKGTLKPVFQGGKKVGAVREYADTLLIFLLKGARPEKYRERHEIMGKGGGPIGLDITAAQAEAEQELAAWRQQQNERLSNMPSA